MTILEKIDEVMNAIERGNVDSCQEYLHKTTKKANKNSG